MSIFYPNCRNCGKENPPAREYCCNSCKTTFYRKNGKVPPICFICSKQFVRKSNIQKYCSIECSSEGRRIGARKREKIDIEKTRKYARESMRSQRERNPEKFRKQKMNWYYANHEKMKDLRKSDRNKAKANEYVKKRYHSDPAYRVTFRMRASMQHALKGQKNGRKWEKMVGYTRYDLVRHLERQFVQGMTWDNMGDWDIDHIVPKSAFAYKDEHDPAFKACWALTNLRPLWSEANKLKSDRREFLL